MKFTIKDELRSSFKINKHDKLDLFRRDKKKAETHWLTRKALIGNQSLMIISSLYNIYVDGAMWRNEEDIAMEREILNAECKVRDPEKQICDCNIHAIVPVLQVC